MARLLKSFSFRFPSGLPVHGSARLATNLVRGRERPRRGEIVRMGARPGALAAIHRAPVPLKRLV